MSEPSLTPRPLTPKQQAFVQEYLVDLNGAAAARRAGYKTKNSDDLAAQLLRKTQVKSAIQQAMDARSKRVEITADYVLKNLVEIGERCMQRAPVMAFDRESKTMLQVQDDEGRDVWEFDANGALRAQELLGKHLKLFTDKQEITGKDGGPLQVQDVKGMTDEQLKALIQKVVEASK